MNENLHRYSIGVDQVGQVCFSMSDPTGLAQVPGELRSIEVTEAVYEQVSPYVGTERFYFSDNELLEAPTRPTLFHFWDWPTKSWLPNLDAAKATKKAEIVAELASRLYLPCNGFDADSVSRERISGTIARLQRGDGLPAGWVGWRDASNQQRWAADDAATVLANLIALSRALEDREQALLIASWQHKANLNALEDFNEILSYDTTAGWPS